MGGIDLGAPCPRVNFEMFSQCEGKRVRVVGKVEDVSGSTMKIKTSDDVLVEVLLQGIAPTDAYVEVDGTVEGGCRIREESPNVGLGNDFGMSFALFCVVHVNMTEYIVVGCRLA